MATLQEINQTFDLNALENELRMALITGDPEGYMQRNINWQGDNVDMEPIHNMESYKLRENSDISFLNREINAPDNGFFGWLLRNRKAKRVKNILCGAAREIQDLIDEEAELKKIIEAGILAVAVVIGIGAVNPLVLTILVGTLAAMILRGVTTVCSL